MCRIIFQMFLVASLLLVGCGEKPAATTTNNGPREVVMEGYPIYMVGTGWGNPNWGKSIDGNPLTINGKVYKQGLGTHAHSELHLNLFGEALRFKAMVGVDDEMLATGASIEFIVTGDGKELFKSGVMKAGEDAKPVDLDVAGIKRLVLTVTDAGNGIGSDHGNWCDATFTVNGRAPEPFWADGPKLVEKIKLLNDFEEGQKELSSDEVLAALNFIMSKVDRIPADDTLVKPILDSIMETGKLPPSMLTKQEPKVTETDVVYLEELGLAKFSCGYGAPKKNLSCGGNPLSIGGRKFERGVGTHGVSKVAIELAGNAKRFKAFVGVDDEMTSKNASMEFVVIGDGKELYRSGELVVTDDAKEIDVDLTGVNILELNVLEAKNGIASDHADWADAHFILANKIMPVAISPEQTEKEKYTAISWSRPISRLSLSLINKREMQKPAREVKIMPSAKYFPGLVGEDVERVTRTVTVDLFDPFWAPTGLYAPAGELVTIEVPAEYAEFGLGVQVSSFTDRLFHKPVINRAPSIARSFSITSTKTEVANGYGGLIYIKVPTKGEQRPDGQWNIPLVRKSTPIKVVISGAVEAPYYRHGETDVNEWRERIRNIDVPVAELIGKHIGFQMPSKLIRELENPDEVIEFWDETQKHQAYIAGWDAPKHRMMFTLDRQISAGGGHSGYPIMAYESWVGGLIDMETVKAKGTWGPFHELGHNHQWSRGWTFQGQGEVTVNLFSLYCNEKQCGWETKLQDNLEDTGGWRRMMNRQTHVDALRKYFSTDPKVAGKYSESGAGERLMIYFQLAEAFGWDAIRKVNASYRPDQNPEFPETDEGRGGEYVVRLSKIVGRNLYPYFFGWGLAMPEGTKERIGDLPVWMPDVVNQL